MRMVRKNNAVRPNRSIVQRSRNTLLRGAGGETVQDRGSLQTASQNTLHPYYNNNFIGRWQEYVRWYMTSWEARKIVDIPVQDALRKTVEMHGLTDDDKQRLEERYAQLDLNKQLRRALIQERLLGGSVMLGIFHRPEDEETASKLNYRHLRPGDLKAVNVVDVSRLSRPVFDTDPFSLGYDRIEQLQVNAVQVHQSRMCILDGNPLLGRGSQMILENFRYNPCGFGESILAPLYDLLIRVIGTQQGAYHLVNLASVLVLAAENLRVLNATGSPAKAKLEEMAEQISIYRAAIVDAKGVEIKNHQASFGSVPELVMSFLQILAAGSDIPATRFLGQAPGGLNATGTSDLENYYNMINAWQVDHVMPVQRRLLDWVGASIWGGEVWRAKSKDMELVYPPLWNQTALEKAQTDSTVALFIRSLFEIGIIDVSTAINELKDREIFMSDIQAGDFLSMSGGEVVENPFGGGFGGISPEPSAARAENSRVYLLNAGKWDEEKHPRGDGGKFGTGGGKTSPDSAGSKTDITEVLGKEHTGVKGQAAIDKLLEAKGGHVKAAFNRDDIGGIDLAWGDDSFGLKHIIKEREKRGIHVQSFLSDLSDVVEKGHMPLNANGKPIQNPKGRYEISLGDKVAVVTPELRGSKMTVLLTAYHEN